MNNPIKNKVTNRVLATFVLSALMVGNVGAVFPSTAIAAINVSTLPAVSVTSVGATLNGTNGSFDAIGHSFWVSTSTFSTVSPTLPSGVYSTLDLGAIASSTSFSASLTSVTDFPAVIPNTTYYFAAWTNVGGTWFPGEILNFTTTNTVTSASPVDLLSAGNFTILSKTGITDTGSHTTVIKGNIGSSAITSAAISVFCAEITGKIYGVDAAYVGSGNQTCFNGNPPLSNKTLVDNAVGDMGIVYGDLAGRTNPTATELGAGNIGGMTLAPGLYKWGTDVSIPTDVTLSGGANDIWIFQIAGNLSIASAGSVPSGIKVLLAGGAKASNVFWQVGGSTGATLGTYSTFNGNIFTAKQIILETGAVLNGRAFAQTQVTLDSSSVTNVNKSNIQSAALYVSSVEKTKGSATADGTFASGWRYVFHVTAPIGEQKLSMKFSDWTNIIASGSIHAADNIRISSAQADNNGEAILITGENNYSAPMLNLISDLDTEAPGRQVDLLVEVAVPVGTVNGLYTNSYGVLTQ